MSDKIEEFKTYMESFRVDGNLELPKSMRNPIVELSKEDFSNFLRDIRLQAHEQFEAGNIKTQHDEQMFLIGVLSAWSALGYGNKEPAFIMKMLAGLPVYFPELAQKPGLTAELQRAYKTMENAHTVFGTANRDIPERMKFWTDQIDHKLLSAMCDASHIIEGTEFDEKFAEERQLREIERVKITKLEKCIFGNQSINNAFELVINRRVYENNFCTGTCDTCSKLRVLIHTPCDSCDQRDVKCKVHPCETFLLWRQEVTDITGIEYIPNVEKTVEKDVFVCLKTDKTSEKKDKLSACRELGCEDCNTSEGCHGPKKETFNMVI